MLAKIQCDHEMLKLMEEILNINAMYGYVSSYMNVLVLDIYLYDLIFMDLHILTNFALFFFLLKLNINALILFSPIFQCLNYG